MSMLPSGLLRSLATLRWFAVAGQAATVALAVHGLGLPFAPVPLWAGVAALALFNLWAAPRARRLADASLRETLLHIGVDIANLTWMIAWSGGAMNPFASLFLLPLALAAVALPWRALLFVAAACGVGYALSSASGRPLPHGHGVLGDPLDLHLWGMAANFIVSGAVVAWFLARLADTLRRREQELARLREQFARSEGIVALATHAAAVAHELNTPLGTLTLMLEDAVADADDDDGERRADLELMAALVDECRDRVRQLAQPADGARASQPRTLVAALDQLVERWQLLRPAVALAREDALPRDLVVTWDAGVGHLLQALLNNAADASQAAGSATVHLDLRWEQGRLRGSVRDFGAGLDAAAAPGRLFATSKPGGLGLGLALSHATVERLGGVLAIDDADGGGVRVRFELPLSVAA